MESITGHKMAGFLFLVQDVKEFYTSSFIGLKFSDHCASLLYIKAKIILAFSL